MKRVTLSEINGAVNALISEHGRLVPRMGRCWGWGASAVQEDSKETPCIRCGRAGGVDLEDGRRCWRCAFWEHMSWCPVFASQ